MRRCARLPSHWRPAIIIAIDMLCHRIACCIARAIINSGTQHALCEHQALQSPLTRCIHIKNAHSQRHVKTGKCVDFCTAPEKKGDSFYSLSDRRMRAYVDSTTLSTTVERRMTRVDNKEGARHSLKIRNGCWILVLGSDLGLGFLELV